MNSAALRVRILRFLVAFTVSLNVFVRMWTLFKKMVADLSLFYMHVEIFCQARALKCFLCTFFSLTKKGTKQR